MSTAMVARPAPAHAQQATAERRAGELRFDIPAGPLDGVLRAFEAATGLTVQVALPADTVAMMDSPGVSGTFTMQAALERLLDGTSLAATMQPGSLVRIEVRRMSESVQVTGQLPHVESPKYGSPLSSTPQTIQVIPQSVMAEQGTFALSDALRNVPGITLQAGEGGGASNTAGDMFNMRGFSAANSLFVDNVRDDGLITRDVYNLEQVEVYLGPTGSDVGRGNAAGYVNMATKTPKSAAAYTGALSYGTAENKRITADINQPLTIGEPGSWLSGTAVRLNALWQDGGIAGRDYAENERRSIAPSISMGLGSPTRVTVQGQFTRQDNVPDYGIPSAAWNEPLTPTTVLASRAVRQENYYGSPNVDYDRADQTSVTARIEHDINRTWSLRNQTRYNQTEREAVVTAIASGASFVQATETVTFSRQANTRDNSIISNQTYLTGRARTGSVSHALTASVELISEDYSAPGLTGVGTRAAESIYNPNPFAPVADFALVPSGATTDGTTRTIAASAFDVVNLTPRVQVSGGIRVENYDTDYRAVTVAGVVTEANAADTIFSGKAGLLYQFSPIGNAYVSYGTTVTPPGTGNFALSTQANNANNPNVDPQVSRNIEVGTKWELFQRRLSATLALFETRNTNVIYTIDATTVPPLFNQDDEQRVQGATLGLLGQLTDHWNVMANFAFMDGRQVSQNAATDNMRITLLPEWSGSLWTTYAVRAFSFGGGIRFTEKAYVNTANTIAVPAYTLVDAVASYAVNSHLTLRLNGYNLTDEVYIRSVNNNGGRYMPGLTRSVLFSTQFGF
ncbi:MAG: TonB-dependent siderophore receptor [Acidobacteria bacterium]|nr:TonB-dependent siderophore receptor [Acidobacteriota bacterium]